MAQHLAEQRDGIAGPSKQCFSMKAFTFGAVLLLASIPSLSLASNPEPGYAKFCYAEDGDGTCTGWSIDDELDYDHSCGTYCGAYETCWTGINNVRQIQVQFLGNVGGGETVTHWEIEYWDLDSGGGWTTPDSLLSIFDLYNGDEDDDFDNYGAWDYSTEDKVWRFEITTRWICVPPSTYCYVTKQNEIWMHD